MGYEEEKLRQLDVRYLRMARVWAENSYCVRRQVGALIVKDKMIISDGYNGTPSGFENICEDEVTGKTKSYVLHAEANAITKVAKSANTKNNSETGNGHIFLSISSGNSVCTLSGFEKSPAILANRKLLEIPIFTVKPSSL